MSGMDVICLAVIMAVAYFVINESVPTPQKRGRMSSSISQQQQQQPPLQTQLQRPQLLPKSQSQSQKSIHPQQQDPNNQLSPAQLRRMRHNPYKPRANRFAR